MKDRKLSTKGIIITLIMLYMANTFAQMDSSSKDQVNNGLLGGQKVVDFLSKLGDPKEDKIFDSLGKMAGFLGAAGGLVSFVLSFLPSSESAELRYMKMKFAEVNMKLDRITAVLDDVKDLITYENQRAVYVSSASKILYGHKQLNAFLAEMEKVHCTDDKNCKRVKARIASRFVNDFKIQQQLFTIIHGATKKTSAFGDPVLQLIQKTFKCDTTKIDHFAASVLKLSFKAQQVILAYEKLTGSNESITQSMNTWLDMLYDLRAGAYKIKQYCYSNMRRYMENDINDKKYQVGVSSNAEAVSKLKQFMYAKYPWLDWVIYSYKQYGGSKHCITNQFGAFWSMPKGVNNRQRNVISSFVDKTGTYRNQKYKVMGALDEIVKEKDFIKVENDACQILPVITTELRKKGVYRYVTSFNILRKYDDFQMSADNKEAYIDKEYTLVSKYMHRGRQRERTDKVRLVIVLRSEEDASWATCELKCYNSGLCKMLPYSSKKSCQCKPYYQGHDCKEHAKAHLSKTVDAMLAVTLKLPTLSDVAFDISDLREYVGIGFGATQAAIGELDKTLTNAFNTLSLKLTDHFQWANLITQYNHAIRSIKYYSYRFQYISEQYLNATEAEGKRLAATVLQPDAIQKWMYEINYLILGRTATPLITHAPVLHAFMSKYNSLACTSQYKAAVDNAWRQLVILQQIGYMIWAQALAFEGKSSEHVKKLYESRTANQVQRMNESACSYSIQNSKNIDCVGGNYLLPSMTIENRCMANYHVNGSLTTSCNNRRSECISCDCNPEGSETLQCEDITGKCKCTSGYYGLKCTDRDCKIGDWSTWSSCSKSCDYGGIQTRTRSERIIKEGNGKPCQGLVTETKSCFNGCCKSQIHCKNEKKCHDPPKCSCKPGVGSCFIACVGKSVAFVMRYSHCL